MDNPHEKLFTVGELSRRCGVTVRTLQYYDSIDLLSPRRYTEGGRRLYGRDDVILLQQILFLKSFGFSLEEIRDRLLSIGSADEIAGMLSRQRDALSQQAGQLQKMSDYLTKVIEEIRMNGYLDTEKLVAIMEIMKQGSPYSFILRYFDQKEMKSLVKWFDDENKPQEMALEWQALFAEMTELYKAGADPLGPEGQDLAARWWAQVQQFTGGDPELMKTLMDMGNDVDNWPEQDGDFTLAMKNFAGIALERYLRETAAKHKGE